MANLIIVDPRDNVATTVASLAQGDALQAGYTGRDVPPSARQAVPTGHKVALTDFSEGDEIVKYGAVIGVATTGIVAGDHVHIHNIASTRIRGDLKAGDLT